MARESRETRRRLARADCFERGDSAADGRTTGEARRSAKRFPGCTRAGVKRNTSERRRASVDQRRGWFLARGDPRISSLARGARVA